MEDNIKTFIRLRPPQSDHHNIVNLLDNQTLSIADTNFTFDHVGCCTQEEIFETIGVDLCKHALDGYNSTLFCYGQTGIAL